MIGEETADTGLRERKDRRSLVLLAAKLRTPQGIRDVRLRNLSVSGALLEAENPPAQETEVVFERGETVVAARVAWRSGNRFGIQFHAPIEEREVLVHVSRPKPSPPPPSPSAFKRPGLRTTLTAEERAVAESWGNAPRLGRYGE
jgi:hypothetical protein